MRLIGFVGWSGAGKTTLICRLIPLLRARGLRVATVKHAHHGFDIDTPGKDSWLHREAGATEVLVASDRRWALMHENDAPSPPRLPDLLARLAPADLVIAEGFKSAPHPRIEVFRAALGKPALYPDDPAILAIAADTALPDAGRPVAALDDIDAIADLALRLAAPPNRIPWETPSC